MLDTIRTSFAGELIHLLSGGRLLQFPEQRPGFVVPTQFGVQAKVAPSDASQLTSVNNADNLEKGSETPEKQSEESSVIDASFVVDWYGPDDPENPMNWSTAKKWMVIAEICLLTTTVYMGSAMYTPAVEQVMEEFHIGSVTALIPLSTYVIAYGIGPMIFAPLSEAPVVGRNWVYLPSLALFVILQIPTALVSNLGGWIVLRTITGFISSSPLSNGGASIGDLLDLSKLSYGIALWSVSAVLGPVLGPFFGSIFSQVLDWRWTFWFLAWVTGATLAILLFFLPETSAATILQRRAWRLRKLTGNSKYTTKAELEFAGLTLSEFAYDSLVRPFIISFTEVGVFFLNCYTALIYAVMYCWFEAFPIVFVETHKFNLIEMGLSYFGITIGNGLSCVAYCFTMRYYIVPRLMGGAPPEMLFNLSLVGAPLLPIALLIFGWTSSASIHWIVPIIGSGLFVFGGFLIFQSIFNYLGMSYPRYMASVFAGNDLFRSSFAAAFPLFSRAMFVNLGSPGHENKFPVSFGSTLLAGIATLMILIPIVLLRMGDRLRAKSKYAN